MEAGLQYYLLKHQHLLFCSFTIFHIRVEDNGVGRDLKSINKTNNNNRGLELIRKRIELINKRDKTDKNNLEITDLKEGDRKAGTRVVITLAQNYSDDKSKKRGALQYAFTIYFYLINKTGLSPKLKQ